MKRLMTIVLTLMMVSSFATVFADNTTAGAIKAGSILQEDLPVVTETKGMLLYRWNSYIFNEFVLPNGKRIVFDPFMYDVKNQYTLHPEVKASDYIEGADYIILTHTHFDHVRDLPDLLEHWPNAFVVVPEEGALSMIYALGLNPSGIRLLPVSDGEKLEFDDFTLDVYRGIHTFPSGLSPNAGKLDINNKSYKNEDGTFNSLKFDAATMGGRDMMNYKITTNDGWTITMWAGQMDTETRKYYYRDSKPDFFFYQNAKVNLGGDRDNPNTMDLAKMVAMTNPKICMPCHQNDSSWVNILKAHDYTAKDINTLGTGCATQFFSPDPKDWYGFNKNQDGEISAYVIKK